MLKRLFSEYILRISVEFRTMSQIRTTEMGDGGDGEVKVLSGSNSISQRPQHLAHTD